MSTIRIRPGRPDEAAALTEIAFAAKRHWGYPESWIDLWRDDLTVLPQYIDDNIVYVAEKCRESIGFVALDIIDVEAEVDHLWVLPAHMGKGVGRQLMHSALRYCRSTAVESVRVVSDPNARAFYAKLGAVYQREIDSNPKPRKLPLLSFQLG